MRFYSKSTDIHWRVGQKYGQRHMNQLNIKKLTQVYEANHHYGQSWAHTSYSLTQVYAGGQENAQTHERRREADEFLAPLHLSPEFSLEHKIQIFSTFDSSQFSLDFQAQLLSWNSPNVHHRQNELLRQIFNIWKLKF